MSYPVFMALLEHLYTDSSDVARAHAAAVAADFLGVDHLKAICVARIEADLSVDTVCEALTIADKHLAMSLKEMQSFIVDHFQEGTRCSLSRRWDATCWTLYTKTLPLAWVASGSARLLCARPRTGDERESRAHEQPSAPRRVAVSVGRCSRAQIDGIESYMPIDEPSAHKFDRKNA